MTGCLAYLKILLSSLRSCSCIECHETHRLWMNKKELLELSHLQAKEENWLDMYAAEK